MKDDGEKILNTSNYEVEIPLLIENNEKDPGITKNKLGGLTMEEFTALHPKIYSFLKGYDKEEKRQKEPEKLQSNTTSSLVFKPVYKQRLLMMGIKYMADSWNKTKLY